MIPLTQNEIVDILDAVMQDITNRMDKIYPCQQGVSFSNDTCTVCTTFEGGYDADLILYMDTALLCRLTKQALQEETVSQQDIEEFSKEYFNVICGHIVARIFQAAHIASRFSIPRFYPGQHTPSQTTASCHVLNYVSGNNEGVQLVHQLPAHFPES